MVIPLVAAVVLAGAAGGVIWLRRRFMVITVRGSSMEPTLREGERVLVRRVGLSLVHTGSLVVFSDHPQRDGPPPLADQADASAPHGAREPEVTRVPPRRAWVVKRVHAIPGDPVPRTVIPAPAAADHDRVPAGSLVVLGDNADMSRDSRWYGYLPADRLLGVVLRKL